MNNQPIAQSSTVQLQMSKFSVKRKSIRKPVKQNPLLFCNVQEFCPEIVKQQIAMFCSEISDIVTARAIVSVSITDTGVNVTVSSPAFKLSMIYTEGGTV